MRWFGRKKGEGDSHKEAFATGTVIGRMESVADRLDKLVNQLQKIVETEQGNPPQE